MESIIIAYAHSETLTIILWSFHPINDSIFCHCWVITHGLRSRNHNRFSIYCIWYIYFGVTSTLVDLSVNVKYYHN